MTVPILSTGIARPPSKRSAEAAREWVSTANNASLEIIYILQSADAVVSLVQPRIVSETPAVFEMRDNVIRSSVEDTR